ncbi:VanW family protein [Brevibacillus sp. H7]|uniref:VanW family protein n=1 Tax=Brevibacillus sp. H7 TaxID=3349138 RepID=UPI003801B860
MFFSWMAGLLLLLNPIDVADFLQIEYNGEIIAYMDRAGYTIPFDDIPLVDDAKLYLFAQQLEAQVYQPPVNASFNDKGEIVPETKGRTLNHNAFIQQFFSYYYSNGPMRINQIYQDVYPKVDRELLKYVSQKRIGQYVTFFNPNNKNRSHNISLAAKAINNYVVMPGEIFSFNKVVGMRTKAKGYLQAPVIVKGELSEGIGGGICQVSSTLYNAVDHAGLHIVKRYSHSRHVPYVPPGRDATVSWYGPDFVFQNKYPYPVLIRARSQSGRMAVTIHSFPEIEHEPRHVPSVRNQLPEETPIGKNSIE